MLVTLTTDVGKVLSAAQLVKPKGELNFVTGIRVAQVGRKQHLFGVCSDRQ